jgi:hypothetical protein
VFESHHPLHLIKGKRLKIQIIATSVETKNNSKGKPYQQLEVTYKNLTFQGKTESKKLFDFGAGADAFKVMADAPSGSQWEVSVVKNAQGYNDWTTVKPASAGEENTPAPQGRATGAQTTGRSTYETPEERAQRQVYIIRQSSLSAAVSTLSVGAKAVKSTDVIDLAEQYVDFVMNGKAKDRGPSGFGDFPDVPEFDVPEVR